MIYLWHTQILSIMKKILFIVMLFPSLPLFSQRKIADLKKEDFISDFDLSVNIIRKQHPNPFKFIKEEAFNHKVDSLRKYLVSNPDIYNFLSSSPLRLIKDVHTSGTVADDLSIELFKSISYFPYPVLVEKGRVFVNIMNKEIPFGSEITTINKVPVKKILTEIASNVDGYIQTGADRNGNDFARYYSFRYRDHENYTIAFIKPGKTEIEYLTVSPVSASDYSYRSAKCVLPFNLLQQSYSIYSDLNDQKQTGILTVGTFNLSEDYAYKEFSNFFKEVNQKKYTNVIIDIRRNSGGNPAIAALLYSFITKNSFANTYTYKTKNITLSYPQYVVDGNMRTYSDEDIRSQNNYLYQRFDKNDTTGWYTGNSRLMEGLLTNFPKDKDAFSGSVKVLVGAETISAATYFASLVKVNKRGLIIGKETASGVDATTAAWFASYQLPATKSVLTIPLTEIYFFNATKDKGRGLMPDKELPIELFIKYALENKDPEMTYAMGEG